MAPTNPPRHGDLDYLAEGLNYVEKKSGQTANQKTPTIPIYDSANWPDDAVDGQLARDKNDLNSVYQYQGEESDGDNAWHKVGGGGIDYLKLSGSFVPINISTTENFSLNAASLKTNDASLWDFASFGDPSIYNVIYPQKPGFYTCMYAVVWQPTTDYQRVTQVSVESFFGATGFDNAYTNTAFDAEDTDQVGQTGAYLPQVGSVVGPASGVASGQIIVAMIQDAVASVPAACEVVVMRYGVN
jgi:hypothetical protein